jgi:hypothetical protein
MKRCLSIHYEKHSLENFYRSNRACGLQLRLLLRR